MSDGAVKNLLAKIRNMFQLATLDSRNADGTIKVQTVYGRIIDNLPEAFPYGFSSRAKKGTVTVFCAGGNLDAVKILPVESIEGAPDLEDGDVAIYSSGDSFVICRQDGSVELNGTENSGVVKADELKAQLDKNNQILQAFLNTLKTPIAEAGNGSPSAFQAALNSALISLPIGDFSSIKSEKVLHGNG